LLINIRPGVRIPHSTQERENWCVEATFNSKERKIEREKERKREREKERKREREKERKREREKERKREREKERKRERQTKDLLSSLTKYKASISILK
jgi:hypothetical protein